MSVLDMLAYQPKSPLLPTHNQYINIDILIMIMFETWDGNVSVCDLSYHVLILIMIENWDDTLSEGESQVVNCHDLRFQAEL